MSRLTRWKINNSRDKRKIIEVCDVVDIYADEVVYEACEKLAHYEDLEEQGRLIELPCAVGEPIFEVQKENIVQHSLSRNWRIVRYLDEGIFGEIAFTTKEEAEEKLAELRGKHD